MYYSPQFFLFFFNDTATTEIYTLSLHDALPIYRRPGSFPGRRYAAASGVQLLLATALGQLLAHVLDRIPPPGRSEEHTSELQSHSDLVCRLLLEKKNRTLTHS